MDPNVTAAAAQAATQAAPTDMTGVFLAVGLVIVIILGILLGRLMDLDFRVTQGRRWLHRNFVVLNILEGDGAVYQARMVDLENDTVSVDNYTWVVDKHRIYRKDKESIGTVIKKGDVRWGAQGAPNIFVSKDDIKALALDDPEKSILKPAEVGSSFNALWLNRRAKDKAALQKPDWTPWISIGLAALCLILLFNLSGKVDDFQNSVKNGSIAIKSAPANINVTYSPQPAAPINTNQPGTGHG